MHQEQTGRGDEVAEVDEEVDEVEIVAEVVEVVGEVVEVEGWRPKRISSYLTII